MNQQPPIPDSPETPLVRSDLIRFESLLKKNLERFFSCEKFSLSFPPNPPAAMQPARGTQEFRAILEEDRLLLPLAREGTLLGIGLIREIDEAGLRPLVPVLPRIAELVLENIRRHKASITDPLTGLRNRIFLQAGLEREIGFVVDAMTPGRDVCVDAPLGGHRAGFGLVLVDMDHFTWVNRSFGHLFGDSLLAEIGATLEEICPEQTIPARIGADSFAVLWPQGSPARCLELAETIRSRLSEKVYTHDLSRDRITLTASIGLSCYPQDCGGGELQKPVSEQARVMIEKAEQGLARAKTLGRDRVCAFSAILRNGGSIREILSLDRVRIDLGKNAGATEGQRFQIRAPEDAGPASGPLRQAATRGEIVLTEIGDTFSIGEILANGDPARPPQVGDRLVLIRDGAPLGREGFQPPPPPSCGDPGGLRSFRDFLTIWHSGRTGTDSCCVGLVRLENDRENPLTSPDRQSAVRRAIDTAFGADCVCGRYSQNCIIFSSPLSDPELVRSAAEELARLLSEGLDDSVCIGMACHPFLDSARSDIPENARKALDHAGMLPRPRVALCDSISLTVRGDRLFAQGDMYAAMEEYKQALVADEHNILARNSLAVCYARLNRTALARQHFRQILAREPDNLMTLYNYGSTCLRDRDTAEAAETFTRCLELDPDHVYALFRMGAMAEQRGDLEQAGAFYRRVGRTATGQGAVARHLGRLALRRGEPDQAREHLHQAIVANPRDHTSLHLLAGLYLDRGEDPEIAETLARQSVNLRPDLSTSWEQLARALEAQGRTRQAEEARNRARDCEGPVPGDMGPDAAFLQKTEKNPKTD
jgi:diguanylate cyclase (GGDEF)-like protein